MCTWQSWLEVAFVVVVKCVSNMRDELMKEGRKKVASTAVEREREREN
jgi:hypothetical protein